MSAPEGIPAAIPEAIPEGSLLLHIGPQKTGSTAIQDAMHLSRQALASHGVLYPGSTPCQHEAGWAVMGLDGSIGQPRPRPETWRDLATELRTSTLPRACLSNEDLARADDDAVDRILGDLGAERVHLVFVARRLDALLPSYWQQRLKARSSRTYEEFLHVLLDEPRTDWEYRTAWEPHDVAAITTRWGRHLPAERMTVVIADEADRTLLPRTFAALLDVPDGLLRPRAERSNASMTYTEAEVVRRLNELYLASDWTPQQYWRLIQTGAVRALPHTRAPGDPQLAGLPAWAWEKVADRAQAQVEAITAAGCTVVGDPAALLLRGRSEPAELPPPVTSVPVELVADVVRGVVDGAERLHRRELARARRATARARSRSVEALSARQLARELGARLARRLTRR